MTYHEHYHLQRQKFYMDVYVAEKNKGAMSHDAAFMAQTAVQKFDTEYPAPIKINIPVPEILKDKP